MNFYINTPTTELIIKPDETSTPFHKSPQKMSLHGIETIHFGQKRSVGKRSSATDLIITDEEGDEITITLFSNTAEGVQFVPKALGILESKIKLEGEVS